MLCCGRKKDPQHVITQRLAGSASAGFGPPQQAVAGQPIYMQTLAAPQPLYANLPVRRAVHFGTATAGGPQSPFSPAPPSVQSPMNAQLRPNPLIRPVGPGGSAPEIVLQNDFRRVSGLTSDVFRQLETVERMFDSIGVPADALQRPGEMLVRVLDPRLLGPAGAEAGVKYLAEGAARPALGPQCVQFVEILKRPGQTLGLYIREGDGMHCNDGVFVSRIAIDSPVRHSGLLKVGDEILAVNLVDVGHMSLDDVVLLMSIPRRLLLTTRSSLSPALPIQAWRNSERSTEPSNRQPVVILKSGIDPNLDESRRTELGPAQRRLLDGVANLVGGAGSIEVTGDEIIVDGHLVVYEDPYGRIGLRPREDTGWPASTGIIPGTASVGALPIIVNQQPLAYDTGGRLQLTRAHIHRPPSALAGSTTMLSRSGSLCAVAPLGSGLTLHHPSLFDRHGPVLPSRLAELSAASRLGLQPTLSDYFLDRLQRPTSRLSQLSVAAPNSRRRYLTAAGPGQIPQSMSTQGLATMIRRRASVHGPPVGRSRSRAGFTPYDASCSDSELAWAQLPVRPASALGVPRPYPAIPINAYDSGRASSMSLRSQSLPRSRHAGLPDFRFNSASGAGKGARRPVGQVRFDKSKGLYGSSAFDDDSDGPLSDSRTKRMFAGTSRRNAPLASSEYRDLLIRAPSTSAIYDSVRRNKLPSTTGLLESSPHSFGPTLRNTKLSAPSLHTERLAKSGQSAESLLESIKQEQRASAAAESIYSSRAAPALPPRAKPASTSSLFNRDSSTADPLITSSRLRSDSHVDSIIDRRLEHDRERSTSSAFSVGALKKPLPGAVNVLPTGRPLAPATSAGRADSESFDQSIEARIDAAIKMVTQRSPPSSSDDRAVSSVTMPSKMLPNSTSTTSASNLPGYRKERPASSPEPIESDSLDERPDMATSTDLRHSSRFVPNPTPVRPSEHERVHLLTLNPREFVKHRGDSETMDGADTGEPPLTGLLDVHLLAARGLRSQTNTCEYRDLYAVVECERVHRARTVVRSGESSFDWDERFELDVCDVTHLAFLLYSWDSAQRHQLCYKGRVRLPTLGLARVSAHALALKMQPKGTLYVRITFRSARFCFQRHLAAAVSSTNTSAGVAPLPAPLFGVPLDQLIARESTGHHVPLLIRRCVEQVELRALTLVGVYRLCGSAVRKRALRDALERNCWLSPLDSEHVPDVNVITGVLKDFLRELPEPLFTKALFEMMVDGLSVCLPDDPNGNAKLMGSILECLPKCNRATVTFLMDHLKLVLSHSDRNKMNSHAIAIIFGPLFTCSESELNIAKTIEVFQFLIEIWPKQKDSLSDALHRTSLTNRTDLNANDFSGKSSSTLTGKTTSGTLSPSDLGPIKRILPRPEVNGSPGTSTLNSTMYSDPIAMRRSSLYGTGSSLTSSTTQPPPPTYPKPAFSSGSQFASKLATITTTGTSVNDSGSATLSYSTANDHALNDPSALYATVNSNRSNRSAAAAAALANKKSVGWANQVTNGPTESSKDKLFDD